MTGSEVREQLSIVRTMIEKSRRETAESGSFFIWIGLIGVATVAAIRALEVLGHSRLTVPALVAVFVAGGVAGYLLVARRRRQAGARSYPATVCYTVWAACAIPMAVTTFVFPMIGLYPWSLVPVLAALFMGIGVFMSGAIFEVRAITWSGFAWWGGAVAMALVEGSGRAWIMAAILLAGMVYPGVVLNRHHRRERGGDAA